ncbi:hypothetical protein SYJ56_24255 [Algoriphagus sp. D3-2-R+10]|uniref:hypothetical protein n=1 Tax=Algoriphagus aurantiacus TaxID=3103948 RepID=UPI002B37E187|nr:hypothetical protein [Algoriphagus sp. D3-2-R+10]MEB2778445.1 hypothetical protein [Algoriphagus sp. D3-2-R+10]
MITIVKVYTCLVDKSIGSKSAVNPGLDLRYGYFHPTSCFLPLRWEIGGSKVGEDWEEPRLNISRGFTVA